MREIKFRAWDEINHEMLDADDMKYGVQYNNKTLSLISQKECFTFMQFTGFKDKNGVEIYEGDIIKGLHDFGMVFEERMTSVHYDDDFCGYPVFTYWLRKTIEVIGNIYENPELIKETA